MSVVLAKGLYRVKSAPNRCEWIAPGIRPYDGQVRRAVRNDFAGPPEEIVAESPSSVVGEECPQTLLSRPTGSRFPALR